MVVLVLFLGISPGILWHIASIPSHALLEGLHLSSAPALSMC